MAGISGQINTFESPNYEGELYNVTPEDTPLLSAIGGLFGGEPVFTTIFSWQEYDLRDVDQRVAKEGQDAPAGTGRKRANVSNVLQIIHETIEVSYTKQATSRQVADIGSNHPNVVSSGQGNPVVNEFDWQMEQRLKEIARDCEYTILNGVFQEPSDNNTERKTRGLIAAVTTNVHDAGHDSDTTQSGSSSSDDVIVASAHGLTNGDKIQFTALTGGAGLETNKTYYVVNAATNTFQLAAEPNGAPINFTTDIASGTFEQVEDLTADMVLNLMQDVWDNGGIRESETATLIANSWNKRRLTKVFLDPTNAGFRQDQRNVGGVNLQTFDTDFGRVNVMLNRYCPPNTIVVASLEELRLKWLAQDQGTLFVEPLGKTGAYEHSQIYGEWGLQYGNERAHGVLSGLSTR